MEVKNVAALRDEFASLHKNSEELNAKTELSAEDSAALEKNFARMDVIKKALDNDAKLAAYAFKRDEVVKSVEMPGKEAHEASIVVGESFDKSKIDREDFARAATRWAKTGEMDRKYATITTASQSGILLPSQVVSPLTPNYANTFRLAHAKVGVPVFTTGNTATIKLPVFDGSAGGVVTETASSETEAPPSLSESITLAVSTYQSGSCWFSNQELMAVDFDLFSAVLPQLVFEKELGLESAIVSAVKADSSITNVTYTASKTAITFGELASLRESLPKRYQQNVVIILSQAAHAAYAGLATSTGQPIMTLVDPQGTQTLAFQGVPVLRSDYLEGFGTSKVLGIVMSLNGFRLRDCAGEQVARYTQFPARPSQSGFNLFAFHSYGYAPSAMGLLKTTT